MDSVLLQLLPIAIGLAVTPVGLVEMILILLSNRARINGIVFLAAIVVPVFAVPFLGAAGVAAATDSGDSPSSPVQAWILLAIAAALLFLAWRNFAARHDTSTPAIFSKIENMSPVAVLLLAPGVTVVNPKNLLLLLSAGSIAAQGAPSALQLAGRLAVFTVVATLPFLAAVGFLVFGGKRAEATLLGWKEWLLAHNKIIMATVLGVLGLVMAAKGLTAVL